MGELSIRRNRDISLSRYQSLERTGKTEKTQKAESTRTPAPVERLSGGTVKPGARIRESRQILRTGEGVLAEVRDTLEQMADLIQQAEGDGEVDREALQKLLDSLRGDIQRMTSGAAAGKLPLFLDGGTGALEDVETLLAALKGEGQTLPEWVSAALDREPMTAEQLLSALGLESSADIRAVLEALSSASPESNEAAAYLTSLYLGAVISGSADLDKALEGLQQLLDRVAAGLSPDAALADLTGGLIDSLEVLQAQVAGGSAPELQALLLELLGGVESVSDSGLSDLLAVLDLANLNAILQIVEAMGNQGLPENLGLIAASGQGSGASGSPEALLVEMPEMAEAGMAPAAGPDLSGVAYDAERGVLTVSGDAPVMVQVGGAANVQTLQITGNGLVVLRGGPVEAVQVDAPQARLVLWNGGEVGTLQLTRHTALHLSSAGLLRLGELRGDESNVLRLAGGPVVLGRAGEGTLPLPVILEQAVSLAAQGEGMVSNAQGQALTPLDLVWQTLLPGWSHIASLTVNGKEVHLAETLAGEPLRLWLEKGERGLPIHNLVLRGQDAQKRPRVGYASLRWYRGAFREAARNPNPFTVIGGEEGLDWVYDEENLTLWILTDQVEAVIGGQGEDGDRPFSGRLALADGLGETRLTLGGVVCRADGGSAFRLGRRNRVTLELRSGSENRFTSGGGFAGISLGEDTTVVIDCTEARGSARNPAGCLRAEGGSDGGAGIGRDSGGGRDWSGSILIQGGEIEASGSGGGAGIGGGRWSALGPVTILGGTVTANGSGGGAGIGGALGGPVGDITIRGGTIAATAEGSAAAIGAGVQGSCGDIRITGTARIIKAVGGNPGADIGACLAGECGRVEISGGADTGKAGLRRQGGIPLETGDPKPVTLPQFRLSAKALGLDRISVATREAARDAASLIEMDRRWVSLVQEAYGTLSGRLERRTLLRDTGAAGSVLRDARAEIPRQTQRALGAKGGRNPSDIHQLLR